MDHGSRIIFATVDEPLDHGNHENNRECHDAIIHIRARDGKIGRENEQNGRDDDKGHS